eukprot:826819-Alexandrium_andersonii.AAC.1
MRGAGSGCAAATPGAFAPTSPLEDAAATGTLPAASPRTGSTSPEGRASFGISVLPTSCEGAGEHDRFDWETSGRSASASSDFRMTP